MNYNKLSKMTYNTMQAMEILIMMNPHERMGTNLSSSETVVAKRQRMGISLISPKFCCVPTIRNQIRAIFVITTDAKEGWLVLNTQ